MYIIQAHPLATVVANQTQGLEATHIPLLWVGNHTEFGSLYGHFARANKIWKNALPEQDWLVIFHNTGHYISAKLPE